MYPRLYLARNLLHDDGVIFISIDDNEVNNLRKVCDEIFGEENFNSCITRVTGTPTGGGNKVFVNEIDYILVYSKKSDPIIEGLPMSDDDAKIYDQEDEFGKYLIRPLRRTGGEDKREDRPSMFYSLKAPDGSLVFPYGPTGYESRWGCGINKYNELLSNNLIEWKKIKKDGSETWQVYQKYYLEGRQKQPSNLWHKIEGNKKATRDVRNIFNGKKVFDFPKPIEVIQQMIRLCTSESDDIILDFFAGSATTAHAVLDLAQKGGGSRRFILVQLPEPCSEDSEAYKEGYKTISEIGKERIRRVINNLNKEQGIELNLEHLGNQDRGFKVLKLDKSNFKQWQKLEPSTTPEIIAKQLELHIEHIDNKSTPEDLLYEILLKAGFTLTEKIETKTIAGKNVFSIAEGALLLCLESEVTKELIDAVAEAEPMQFISLDSAFHGNDQLKANAVQTFAARNMQKEKHNQIIFKTI